MPGHYTVSKETQLTTHTEIASVLGHQIWDKHCWPLIAIIWTFSIRFQNFDVYAYQKSVSQYLMDGGTSSPQGTTKAGFF